MERANENKDAQPRDLSPQSEVDGVDETKGEHRNDEVDGQETLTDGAGGNGSGGTRAPQTSGQRGAATRAANRESARRAALSPAQRGVETRKARAEERRVASLSPQQRAAETRRRNAAGGGRRLPRRNA